MNRRSFLASVAMAGLVAAAPSAFAAEPADVIYTGGPILTMDDDMARAEAVAVRAGRIVAVGPAADVMALKGDGTRIVDLGGRAMLPGFVDPHGHVVLGGLQAMSANMLPPPGRAQQRYSHPAEDAEGLGCRPCGGCEAGEFDRRLRL